MLDEKEALAPVFGLGCPDLLVTVGHRSLTRIFFDQGLENIMNLCLFDFKERTLMYIFRIKNHPGKLNVAPDCASRYPAGSPSENLREDDHASAAQAQQDTHKPLETVMVYSAQTIDSTVKATCTPMNESEVSKSKSCRPLVESAPKAPFSIATTPMCREGW